MDQPAVRRRPLSAAHAALGALLRQARVAANSTTRQLSYASGHISNVENGYAAPSHDLLEAYIALGADRDAATALFDRIQHEARASRQARLREERRTGGRPLPIAPSTVSDRTRPDDVRRHYTVEGYDVDFRFDGHGAIRTVTSLVAIRATSPEVNFYYTGHAPEPGRIPPDTGVKMLSGGTIERVNMSPLGAADIYIRLDRTLSPGERDPYRLSYQIDLVGRQLADSEIQYVTRPGIRQHRLTAQFVEPAVPRRIWWVATADGLTGNQAGPHNELSRSPSGRYEYLFDQIIPGWYYGFAWTWPDSLRVQPAQPSPPRM